MTRSGLEQILLAPGEAIQLGPGLFSVLPAEARAAPYDRKAALYDAVVGRSLYHRVFWGTSARAFTRFGRTAIEAAAGGWLAEVGCGSLLFTHALYRKASDLPTVLIDRSLRMLERGAVRLRADTGTAPDNVVLLHADAAALPLRPAVCRAVLSLNLLHVPCDVIGIAREIGRILEPGRGRLYLSCLVRSGRWSDAYLRMLNRAGELGAPWTPDELGSAMAGDWGVVDSATVEGNMCFMVVRHGGRVVDQ